MTDRIYDDFDAIHKNVIVLNKKIIMLAGPSGSGKTTTANKIKEKLEKKTGKTVVLTNTVDRSVISGIILRYMGIQLDGSLAARLAQIEKSLKNTIL